MKKYLFPIVLVLLIISMPSCKKEKDEKGTIQINFDFLVDGSPLVVDSLQYINEAENQYMITEIQYFISDLTFHKSDGSSLTIEEDQFAHYIDTDLPETHQWQVPEEIAAGNYNSISFTFGFNEVKNQSLIFPDPPESYMFWPEHLGGGYHYMKLNGKWLNLENEIQPFNFHLGIGQIYESEEDSIPEFIHNYFIVNLENSAFSLATDENKVFTLSMNIEEWFKNPEIYDLNFWGGHIMQNQAAMSTACGNGQNAFIISINEE